MAFRKQRQARYSTLRAEHFTPREARELSKLSKNTPALQALRADRIARFERFSKIAAGKLERGKWRKRDLPGKWVKNLSRLYTKRGWRVKEGPRGKQQPMPLRGPNPWAMFRDYQVGAGVSKDYIRGYPDAEGRRQARGKVSLLKGLVSIQQAEKKGGASPGMIRQWIAEKNEAIKSARGKRRVELMIERNRLERLLA